MNVPMTGLTILYDGKCGLCRASVARLHRYERKGQIAVLDLHDPSAAKRFPQVNYDEAMRLMQAVDASGKVHSGVDAWARAGMALPGWKLVARLLLVPGIHFIAAKIYAWIARNRYRWNRDLCADGSCDIHTDTAKPHVHSSTS